MHFSHAVVLAFIAATASAQYGYSDRGYAGIARRYADPAVDDYGLRASFPVRRSAYPEPEPILGFNHAKQAYHAAKKHFGHHKHAGQAAANGAAQGMQSGFASDPSADSGALGRRWAYPEPEAHRTHRGGKKHPHKHHRKPGHHAMNGAGQGMQGTSAAPPLTPPAADPAAAPATDPAAAPATDPAAAPAADPAAAGAAPTKRWAILDAYSKLMARDAEPEPKDHDEIWERDAEPELEIEERDAEPELDLEERDAEPGLDLEERDAEPELDLEERDFDDELYSFVY
ncbi:hypothetical protein MMC26_002494 [Xylographa opegraphella]|nr:hypothetical protein [Xylographa opegraphella]